MAQLAARGSHNPKVASSILAGSTAFCCPFMFFDKKHKKRSYTSLFFVLPLFSFSNGCAQNREGKKSSMSGNRTRGVCVTGRNVTNYTNTDKPPTRIELVTSRLLSACSAN